ncbi:hypothetical protein [Bradyrhizobium elkanii]
MRGLHSDVFSGLRLDPAAKDAAAREDQPMNGITLDHANLKVAIEGRRLDPLPRHVAIRSWTVFIAAD